MDSFFFRKIEIFFCGIETIGDCSKRFNVRLLKNIYRLALVVLVVRPQYSARHKGKIPRKNNDVIDDVIGDIVDDVIDVIDDAPDLL